MMTGKMISLGVTSLLLLTSSLSLSSAFGTNISCYWNLGAQFEAKPCVEYQQYCVRIWLRQGGEERFCADIVGVYDRRLSPSGCRDIRKWRPKENFGCVCENHLCNDNAFGFKDYTYWEQNHGDEAKKTTERDKSGHVDASSGIKVRSCSLITGIIALFTLAQQ